jgi:hypothetical protein
VSAQLALVMPPTREAGMAAALDHAGDEWRAAAFTYLCQFARSHPVVCCEEVADGFVAAGGAEPPDRRAWASLYRQAVRDRVLTFLDFNGWDKRRHSPSRRYRSLSGAGPPGW